jgi:phosphopentomutase
VIARPFVGTVGAFRRTYNRRDYSVVPPAPTLLDNIRDARQSVVGIGKISDIFAGRGLTFTMHSEGNRDGMHLTLEALATLDRGLLFVNLVDFDMVYGHRNDVAGFARALVELDRWLPELEAALRPEDVVFITADHGNDPTTPGTDHTREQVPLLAFGPGVRPARLGTRATFADLGQTIADGLGVAPLATGESFLAALLGAA